ncbi:hypothetical protein J3R83DRAFT_11505 [Lanmaoa asiatica]|nr:hypothetical protein J3R83DRAFT_11505 [Lanmaoa asiatica]
MDTRGSQISYIAVFVLTCALRQADQARAFSLYQSVLPISVLILDLRSLLFSIMLMVRFNSTCDVCLESYMDGARIPHAIACGHIFCQVCLDSIRSQCPLCRNDFSYRDIRKLHVDIDDAPSSTTIAPRHTFDAGGSSQVKQLAFQLYVLLPSPLF